MGVIMSSFSVAEGQITRRPPRRFGRTLTYVALGVGLVFFLLPIVWLVLTSLKKEFEYMAYPITILPKKPVWDNYVQALTVAPFWRYFKNSVFLATTTATLTVASSALVGFGFARLNGPGKNILFSINIATLMIPWAVLGIPQFIVFSKIGLVNTYWPWVIWGLTGSPWHIFLFRQFFAAFPKELEDAAEVDGCGRLRTFVQIFLPNSLPVIAASFIFQFHWVWGDWVTPLLYLNDKLTTLSVILAGKAYVNPKAQVIVTITMAGVVLYMLPLIVVFFFAQRHIMEGVVTTGIKG